MNAVVAGADPEERDIYAFALRQAGLSVRHQARLDGAIRAWSDDPADLLLAVRPDPEGLPEQIDRFRGLSHAPLILLMDSPGSLIQLQCVRAGADLILTLPVEPRLVASYGLNLLRRVSGLRTSTLPALEVVGLKLDPSARSVQVGGGPPTHLTPLEFRLLFLLLTHPGQVLPTEDLIERVWGYSESGSRDLVRGLIRRLRLKLGDSADSPRYLETVSGVGYRLRASQD